MTPARRERAALPGQAAVEFTLVITAFLVLSSAVAYFGYAGYQRARLDHSLSTLGSTLPAGWESMDPEELARGLLLDGSDLVEEDLEIVSASVTVDRDVDVAEGGGIASGLGAGVMRTERRKVVVDAEVSYTFEDALSFGRQVTTTGTAHRAYTAYTDFQVS